MKTTPPLSCLLFVFWFKVTLDVDVANDQISRHIHNLASPLAHADIVRCSLE